MKKTALAIGIIAVLGIGYVGATWYTGNVIENKINDKIKEITQVANIKQDKYNVAITYNDYHKSVFSTKLHLTITISPKDTSNSDVKPIKVFDDNLTVHHGPFPLPALSNGVFSPQMAWLEYQMNEQTSPELWKLAGNQPFLTGYLGISYQNYFLTKIKSKGFTLDESAIEKYTKLYQNIYTTYFNSDFDFADQLDPILKDIKGKFSISDTEVYFGTDRDFSTFSLKSHLPKISYQQDDQNYAFLKELDMAIDFDSEKTDFDFKINLDNFVNTNVNTNVPSQYLIKLEIDKLYSQGSFNFDKSNMNLDFGFDKFELVPNPDKPNETKPAIKLNKLDWKQKNLLNSKGKNDGSLIAKVDLLKYGNQNLGSGVIDLAYENIPKEQIIYDPAKLLQKLYDFNQNKPERIIFTLNKLNWHNAQGDININGLLDFIPNEKDSSMRSSIDNIYALKIKVAAPFNVLAQTMAQTQSLQKLLDNDVAPQELRQMKETIKSWAMMFFGGSPLINFSEGNVEGIFSEVDFSKDSDEVKVNGKSLKKEDLFGEKATRGGSNDIKVNME